MASTRKTLTVIFVSLLVLSGNHVDAGMHRRGGGLADLFAGGLLTLLFTEVAGGGGGNLLSLGSGRSAGGHGQGIGSLLGLGSGRSAGGHGQGLGGLGSLLGLGIGGNAEGRADHSAPAPPAVPPFMPPNFALGGMGPVPPMLGFGHDLSMLGYGVSPHMLPLAYHLGMFGQGRNFGNLGPAMDGLGQGFNFGPMFGLNGLMSGLGGYGPLNMMHANALGPLFKGLPDAQIPGHPVQERTPMPEIPNMNFAMPNVPSIENSQGPENDRRSGASFTD